MSDEEDNLDSPIFHIEGNAAVFEKPPSDEEILRRRRYSEQQKFEREQVRANKRIAGFTGMLVFCTLLSTAIGIWQASVSQRAANAARDAAQTATDTLAEMKNGSGATDTHTLAQQAVTQASQTTLLAKSAAIQPKQTEIVARSSARQADIAAKQESIAEAQALPYIVLANVDLAEPIVPDKPTRLQNTFINAGNSSALDVHSVSRSDSIIDGSTPPYEFRGMANGQVVIAARSTFDSPMALCPLTKVQIEQFNEGLRRVYVTGEVIYSDFRHTVHHTYYCFELSPGDRKMYGCKNGKASD